jgi:PAS domain-containing protein
MSSNIRRLLERYTSLVAAARNRTADFAASELAAINREADQALTHLIAHDPVDRVELAAKLDAMISALAGLSEHPAGRELSKMASAHVDRLSRFTEAARRSSPLGPGLAALLDQCTDRVAMVDRQYRYIMVNRSNARFHSRDVNDFQAKAVWSIVGDACFERLSKPRIDSCLAGERVACFTRWRLPGGQRTFSIRMDPVVDDRGLIEAVIAVARDVSDKGVLKSAILDVPLPMAAD